MKIHLPNSAFLGNLDAFLATCDFKQPNQLHLSSNKRWISVHPLVLAMVAVLGKTIPKEGKTTILEPLEATSKHYLVRMGLFKYLKINPEITLTEHEPAGRFIPLITITTSDALSSFIKDMIPLLHLAPKQAEPISYIISELVRNVLEHAHAESGAIICAQYYKKSNTIRIGIADNGVGIKSSINRSHTTTSDMEALKLALTPGITGTTRKEGGSELNAGAGLFFIKSIAKVNRDFFTILSGNAFYKLLKDNPQRKRIKLYGDPFQDKHSKKNIISYWQGTAVGIDINLDETEEFTLLLDLIRDTYLETIKERKRQRRKRPQFI